jgi:hypothetical protein
MEGGSESNSGDAEYYEENCVEHVKEMITKFRSLIHKSVGSWDKDGTCSARLTTLLDNPRNNAVQRIQGYGFKKTNSKDFFGGVTTRLRRNLWPWNDGSPKKRPVGNISEHFDASKCHRSCPTWGDLHGTIVSNELEECVKAIRKETDLELITADRCTARILDTLYCGDLIPMAAELPVWDSTQNVATALDLLVVDIVRTKIIAIEVKTGYENESYGPLEEDPPLLSPLSWLQDCPEHRNFLQLAATVYLLEKGHGVKIDKAYVIRACSKGRKIEVLEEPDWFEGIGKKIYEALRNS